MCGHTAYAATIAMNTAQMQALDKITGQMSVIEVPVGGEVKFGSFSVIVRSCQSAPATETPENYAFVDVADTQRDGKLFNIFKGWMVSSSPSLNSVEHPIYDVWLLKCSDTKIDPAKILSTQQLADRDMLEKYQEQDLSKEAKIALETAEQQARQQEAVKAAQAEQDRQKEEAKEAKERLLEIEKEMQLKQQPTVSVEPSVDGEGPVSLLNFGQQNSAPSASQNSELLTTPSTLPDTPAFDNDGLVIIEDTHHEIIPQDLDLPADIQEIMPQPQKQD